MCMLVAEGRVCISMPPGGGGSTHGNIADADGRRRPRRRLVIKRSTERKNPENLLFEREIAEIEARQLQEQQRRHDRMAAAFMGTLSLRFYCPLTNILSDDHVKDSTKIKWSDVADTRGTSTTPLLLEDITQQGKGRLQKESANKPPDDTDFLEGTFIKINSDKQKATRNKKSNKNNKKKKKGKGKGKKQQSHASSEMQSEKPTEPCATCADATGGETLASSSSRVAAIHVPLLEYSSSSSSSQVTAKLIITPAVNNSASCGYDEKELSASSSNDDFKSFESSTSYATAASSSVNDYYTGGNAWNIGSMGDYAGSLSDARSERSFSASDSTDSRGFKKKTSGGEGNKLHVVHQSFSLAIGPGCSQEALLCTDSARNDGGFQEVVSRKAAQKMKKMQRMGSPAPTSTMAAPSEIVPRSPFRELTIGDYLNVVDTFYGRKRNKKQGKHQKARSLNNLSKTGYNGMVLITTTVHQPKPRSGHHVTLVAIEETTAPVGDGIQQDTDSKAPSSFEKSWSLGSLENSSSANKEKEKKVVGLVAGVTEDRDSRAPTTSDNTLSLCHLAISSCADSSTEQKKEENRIAFGTHASSSELDKIIKAANDAYEMQAASDVYMISGVHADIENFLHAATPVIGQISSTKSSISLQDQRLWSVWSWYEEPECCGIEVQMQGKINSIWPEFSTYFQPLLSAVQLFGPQNHGGLIFEYFEMDNPYSRPPIFTKIKQLRDGVNLSRNPIFGDPKQLESVKFSDLHPASWFSVAWYPIGQIPAAAGTCQASFLTYHSLGKLVPQTCSDGHDHIICPIVGLLGYKDQEEKWFQLREQLRFKPTRNVSAETDHAELLNKRMRTLRQGAPIMSKAVVPKASGEAMNYHSDYEFFRSRSR